MDEGCGAADIGVEFVSDTCVISRKLSFKWRPWVAAFLLASVVLGQVADSFDGADVEDGSGEAEAVSVAVEP